MEMEKLIEIIADQLEMLEADITPDTDLKKDLDCDSLDVFEIVVNVENELGITIKDEDLESIVTVQDALNAINKAVEN